VRQIALAPYDHAVPELPEVETVARLIRPHLVGRTVRACAVSWPRTVGGRVERFERAVLGARFEALERRAKFLVFRLSRAGAPAGALLGHLRMTGRMHVEDASWDPGKFAKVRLDLDDGRAFHFIDVRKFGRLEHVADPQRALAELGPEPLGEEFTPQWFEHALKARSRALKPLLLDQTFLAGLGNIYVDESLFRAQLHPLANSRRVPPERALALWREIRSTLAEAIAREGSSFDTFYRTPEGNPGAYQDQFKVYGRGGEPCRTCATPIQRFVVGQRGTHVCPRCQPKPRATPRRKL
jgi:formamidopyrimidine-DNA glycosylase